MKIPEQNILQPPEKLIKKSNANANSNSTSVTIPLHPLHQDSSLINKQPVNKPSSVTVSFVENKTQHSEPASNSTIVPIPFRNTTPAASHEKSEDNSISAVSSSSSTGSTPSLSSHNKINFSTTVNLKEGVAMHIPQNPVKPDGTVDIIIQFRGVVPQRFSEGGVNAVVITAETKGLSGPMVEKFGYNNFVPEIINSAMDQIKKKFGPNVKEGRLALGSFSAGYAPLAVALSNPQVRAKTDAVVVIDGIHFGGPNKPDPTGHKPFVDFAREAASGDKLMVITHSSIKPTYSSSTNAADYIMKQVGAQRVNSSNSGSDLYTNRYGETIAPATRSDLNGFHVEGFDGNVAKSHVEQIDNLGNTWNKYLLPRWK